VLPTAFFLDQPPQNAKLPMKLCAGNERVLRQEPCLKLLALPIGIVKNEHCNALIAELNTAESKMSSCGEKCRDCEIRSAETIHSLILPLLSLTKKRRIDRDCSPVNPPSKR
jgi:hypothetical protein